MFEIHEIASLTVIVCAHGLIGVACIIYYLSLYCAWLTLEIVYMTLIVYEGDVHSSQFSVQCPQSMYIRKGLDFLGH